MKMCFNVCFILQLILITKVAQSWQANSYYNNNGLSNQKSPTRDLSIYEHGFVKPIRPFLPFGDVNEEVTEDRNNNTDDTNTSNGKVTPNNTTGSSAEKNDPKGVATTEVVLTKGKYLTHLYPPGNLGEVHNKKHDNDKLLLRPNFDANKVKGANALDHKSLEVAPGGKLGYSNQFNLKKNDLNFLSLPQSYVDSPKQPVNKYPSAFKSLFDNYYNNYKNSNVYYQATDTNKNLNNLYHPDTNVKNIYENNKDKVQSEMNNQQPKNMFNLGFTDRSVKKAGEKDFNIYTFSSADGAPGNLNVQDFLQKFANFSNTKSGINVRINVNVLALFETLPKSLV